MTYPKSTTIQDVARDAPADRILVETDAPFLAPGSLRGQRNEPANTALTGEFLAELRGVSSSTVGRANDPKLLPAFPFRPRGVILPFAEQIDFH